MILFEVFEVLRSHKKSLKSSYIHNFVHFSLKMIVKVLIKPKVITMEPRVFNRYELQNNSTFTYILLITIHIHVIYLQGTNKYYRALKRTFIFTLD